MKTILMITLLLSQSVYAREFKRQFATDLCTAFPERVGDYDWTECCIEHDLYLWAGGKPEHAKLAHERLRECVTKEANAFWANLMHFGITVGSLSPYKLPDKKWGNAWGETDTDAPLSSEEIEIIEHQVFEVNVPLPTPKVDEFLKTIKALNL